jgi:hypothetical protein
VCVCAFLTISNFNSTSGAKTNNKSIHIDPEYGNACYNFAAMLVMEMKMSPLRLLSISIHIILWVYIHERHLCVAVKSYNFDFLRSSFYYMLVLPTC